MWPGRRRSSGLLSALIMTWMVFARSNALIPVVTPEPPVRVDGDRERRPLRVGVLLGHGRKIQLVRALTRERHADEAARVLGHEVDHLGRDSRGGADQVPFVLPILVVGDDDHLPVANVLYGVFDAAEGHVINLAGNPSSEPRGAYPRTSRSGPPRR